MTKVYIATPWPVRNSFFNLFVYTVEPPSEIGHYIINLSTVQRIQFDYFPQNYMPYSSVHLEPLKEDNVSIKDKTADLYCPQCVLYLEVPLLLQFLHFPPMLILVHIDGILILLIASYTPSFPELNVFSQL